MEKVVKKIAKQQKITLKKGENNPNCNKTRLMDAASKILQKVTTQDFEKKTGLDKAYLETLTNYDTIVEARNEWAHKTENEFAYLLLTDQFQEKKAALNTEHWEKLLLWMSGKEKLEQMAVLVPNK